MAKPSIAICEEILREHLPYEIWMLQETHHRLKAGVADLVLHNALIESFCIHARQLLDFFENDQGIHAEDFIAGGYQASHLNGLAPIRIKLNTQIAHLTGRRTAQQADKIGEADREALLLALNSEARDFNSQLTGNFATIFKLAPPPGQTAPLRPTGYTGSSSGLS